MNPFFKNLLGSWMTSTAGAALGLPMIWEGLVGPLLADPRGEVNLGTLMAGLAILVGFLAARDGSKSSEDVGVKGPKAKK